MIEKEKAVMDWIGKNFYVNYIKIEDYPLFPAGKRIIDKNGDEMIVYYDLMYDRVDWTFPQK
ncbi:hypothetical protein [Sporolituus thermophilus]|uniref:Uncharacterized protein n=1 Tax=Sporolituus thermophilus DSM 23256 TaxID=1123285 RepID=A0A1G7KXS3_9FIRM|nr:hypothetical protein [Sporolituus thermophilus]SDF42048.1 hypothetical protein SAMN05660235_01513 [Sporolituus thermophilus DSM 23256]